MITLIDSHAHIQLRNYDGDLDEVIARADANGVRGIITVGFNIETTRAAIELARANQRVRATAGIHPHDASKFGEETVRQLRELASDPNVVALGEMGLDYYRNLSPRKSQQYAFERQLMLAAELNMPVVIHDRDAHEDVFAILKQYDGLRGVMHCFSGDWEFARRCLDIGFHISIAGPVTYPNSADLRDVASKVPIDRLLVETDCPWLAPQHRRGKRNEPAYVRFVAKKIAQLRGISLSKLAESTTRNTMKLFGEMKFDHDSIG